MTTHLQLKSLYLAYIVIISSSLLSSLASAATQEDILSINDAEIDPLNNEVIDLTDNVFLKHMISSRASGFEGPQYLPPKCERGEYCVTNNLCRNGYFTGPTPNGQAVSQLYIKLLENRFTSYAGNVIMKVIGVA